MLDEKSEKSIMDIISEMVREGESEEKIRGTLKSLGVKDAETNRLLLVAQAHTFELLKSEIDRIVESHVSDKRPELKEMLKSQVTKVAEQKMPAPKPEEIAAASGPEQKEKKSFFDGLNKIFFPKKKEAEKPKEETFITPDSGEWQETETAAAPEQTEAEESGKAPEAEKKPEAETYTFSKADIRKLRSLESWHTRYKKKFTYLKQMQKKSKLSEKQIAKKVALESKIRAYSLKIGEIKRRIPKEFLRKLKKRKVSLKEVPEYVPGAQRDNALELKTMQDLTTAAQAITMAAEAIVKASPKPKIVISGNEEFLTIDQEIEKTKHLKKMLEIDFYKRRITLQDFQSKMMEYQTKLYELEEKKRILERSRELGEKRQAKGERVPASIEKALAQKLEGRMNEEKMLEIENYATELLRRYNIPKKEIEHEIQESDLNSLMASLEKMATISQLEMQAKQALGSSRGQAVQQMPQYVQQQNVTVGTQAMPSAAETAPTEQAPLAVEGTTAAPEQAQPVQQPKQIKFVIPQFLRPKQQAPVQQQPAQQQQAGGESETETMQPLPVSQPAQTRERITREITGGQNVTGFERITREEAPPVEIVRRREPERVVLKPMAERKYVKAPPEEPIRVIVEQEKTWSEAEIPSFPQTIEKGEREKVKTIVKEINKFRIITDLDRVLQTIKEKGIIGIEQLKNETGIEKQRLQELVEILEDHKLAKLEYSTFGEEKITDINYVKPKPQAQAKQQPAQAQQQEKKQFMLPRFGKK